MGRGPDEEEISAEQRQGLQRLAAALARLSSGDTIETSGEGTEVVEIPEDFGVTSKASRYFGKEEISKGGMGAIFRVTDRDLGRLSAMKVALPALLRDRTGCLRFLSEARITAQLEHPNIVPVHDLGRIDPDGLFFTMKLVVGEPLSDILHKLARRDRAYEERYGRHALLVAFRKVCDAVAFAHSRGVIHRDIKPQNIMVGRYGEVLLMDWGLAKFVGSEAGDLDVTVAPPLPHGVEATTRIGVVKGTPAYMAPEQACGRAYDVDQQTDVFLLGATLYHILTLRTLYTGRDTDEIVLKAIQCAVTPPNERSPEQLIPEELCDIVAKATAKSKAQRYAHIEELMRDVDAWMAGRVAARHLTFAKGERLMQADEEGREAYVILRGCVHVYRESTGTRIQLGTLGPGDIVGEMALITDKPRSATVVAHEETEVEVITEHVMRTELKKLAPWMDEVVNALAQRLRTADAHLHPLLMGTCFYHVLTHIVLLLEAQARGQEEDAVEPVLNEADRRIAANLALPLERVQEVLAGLAREGLLSRSADHSVRILDLPRLGRLAAYCGRVLRESFDPATPQETPEGTKGTPEEKADSDTHRVFERLRKRERNGQWQ